MLIKRVGLITVLAVWSGLVMTTAVTAQNRPYIWVRAGEERSYPGYRQVMGGQLDRGGPMAVCRGPVNGFLVPGKMWGSTCHVPWGGKELVIKYNFDYLLTNRSWSWRSVNDVSKTQIRNNAIYASDGQKSTGNQYICRMRFNNGYHSGKYAIGSGYCYVAWGDKEHVRNDGFDIMFP